MSNPRKRPRAETQTRSSPQRTRVRVDEPEWQLTLFDEAEVVGVDISVLDDQISNCSEAEELSFSDCSEAGSDLTPLTESPAGSDVEDVEAVRPSNSGDWTGIRKAANSYRLPRVHEDLRGPASEVQDPTPTKLIDIRKEIMKNFCTWLIQHWPTTRLNKELACDRHMALADPTAFWHALFQSEFVAYLEYMDKLPVQNQSLRVRLPLWRSHWMFTPIFF
jgi:hypothetical protein